MSLPQLLTPLSTRNRSSLLLILMFLGLVAVARAQVQVDIAFSRRSFIVYEPIIAIVGITNNAGRDLEFKDEVGKQWFNVEVSSFDDRQLPPLDPDYKLTPLTIPAGKTVKRKIDLTPLFPIRDVGTYRIRASIYMAATDHYFSSNYTTFDLTEGHLLWSKTVGDPAGNIRQMSLLTQHLFDKMLLYVRVRDQDGPSVYTTQSIGRVLVSGSEPQELLDSHNTLHIVHEAVPKGYYYTRVDTDGRRLGQEVYTGEGRDRPHLVKLPSGEVEVRGGRLQANSATASDAVSPIKGFDKPGQPKLSDRPAGLPPATRQGQ